MEVLDMREEDHLLEGLESLMKYVNPGSTFLEIGSYAGQSAEIFLKSEKVETLFCVDAWTNGYDDKDGASSSDMILVEKAFDSRMEPFDNMTKIKGWSYDVVSQFDDESLDVVYIDGTHTYDGVKRDIELYLPKVKKEGLICGHDYNTSPWEEVTEAIIEVLGKPHVKFADGSWLIFKKRLES